MGCVVYVVYVVYVGGISVVGHGRSSLVGKPEVAGAAGHGSLENQSSEVAAAASAVTSPAATNHCQTSRSSVR